METESQRVQPFISKLYNILTHDTTAHHSLAWSPDGEALIITDPESLKSQILPKYFKHDQISSFTRQLNAYGFTKVHFPDENHNTALFFPSGYRHPLFRRDCPQWLHLLQRKKIFNHRGDPECRASPIEDSALVLQSDPAKTNPNLQNQSRNIEDLHEEIRMLREIVTNMKFGIPYPTPDQEAVSIHRDIQHHTWKEREQDFSGIDSLYQDPRNFASRPLFNSGDTCQNCLHLLQCGAGLTDKPELKGDAPVCSSFWRV
jgi:hypothetical protein